MSRFLIKRFAWGTITLFLFITIVFFAVQLVLPYDFTAQFAMQMDSEELAELQAELGLDQPILTRYWQWLARVVHLDFGRSYSGIPIVNYLATAFLYSLVFLLIGTFLAFTIGQYLGKWMAWKRSGILSNLITLISLVLYTTFPPWLAYIVTLIFVPKLRGWLNIGIESIFDMLSVEDLTIPSISSQGWDPLTVIGYILLSLIIGAIVILIVNNLLKRIRRTPIKPIWGFFLVILGSGSVIYFAGYGEPAKQVIFASGLPLITYVLISYAEIMLIMRTSMEDIMDDDFINVARAKGIPERIVRDKHAVRNAILPILSRLIVTIPYLLTGIVILEYTFGWPGMGTSLWYAIQSQDIPLILGFLLFIGLVTLIARLVLEVLHVHLDPRQRIFESPPRRIKDHSRKHIPAIDASYRQLPDQRESRILRITEKLIYRERLQDAQQILIGTLKQDAFNYQAWYLLSLTFDDEDKIVYALEQALRIRPHYDLAEVRLASFEDIPTQPIQVSVGTSESNRYITDHVFLDRSSEKPSEKQYHRNFRERWHIRVKLMLHRWMSNWKIFTRSRLAPVGIGILIVFLLMIVIRPILMNYVWPSGIFDPITGYDMQIQHPAGLSWKHLLGTTFRGRDVFSLLLLATQNSFALGLTAGGVAAITGTILGVLAGYHRGRIDDGLSQFFDVFLLLPAPIFMAFAGSSLRNLGPIQLGAIYGLIAGFGPVAILMRTHALTIVSRPYIEAARVSGGRSWHIIIHHILPHMYPMALLQMLLTITSAVVVDGFLSFLGVSRYITNWGTMLYESAIIVEFFGGDLPWNIYLAPVICFSLFGLAFYLISRGMQRIANPRMRERWI